MVTALLPFVFVAVARVEPRCQQQRPWTSKMERFPLAPSESLTNPVTEERPVDSVTLSQATSDLPSVLMASAAGVGSVGVRLGEIGGPSSPSLPSALGETDRAFCSCAGLQLCTKGRPCSLSALPPLPSAGVTGGRAAHVVLFSTGDRTHLSYIPVPSKFLQIP